MVGLRWSLPLAWPSQMEGRVPSTPLTFRQSFSCGPPVWMLRAWPVRQQPALLGTDPSLLAPKVDLLRELCTDDEFRGLAGSSSFARALTSSLEVLERLRSLPPRADGSPRPIMSGWCAPSTIVNPLPPAPRVPTPPCNRIARSHYEISILARRAHSILKSRKEWEARLRGARDGAGGE